jgi:hypothetical protein
LVAVIEPGGRVADAELACCRAPWALGLREVGHLSTKLDEISRVIGNTEAEVRELSASVAEVRHSTNEHHRDSWERLEAISPASRRSRPMPT